MLQDSDVKIMEMLFEILKPFFQITETFTQSVENTTLQ